MPESTTTESARSEESCSRTTSASREEVDRVVAAAADAGGEVTKAPSETFYGGYAGFFRDPDGHVWEIAHNPGFTVNADGTLTLPDFGTS